MEARYYASCPQMLRMLPAPNPPSWAIGQNPLDVRYFSMQDLRQHARETALVAPSPELLSGLEKLGLHIRWRMTDPISVVYIE